MAKFPHKKMFLVLFLILLSSRAYAINFGSVVRDSSAETTVDQSVKFTMLFWNVENESYVIRLSVKDAPKEWTVIIDPDEFVSNKSNGEEYIKLPYTDEIIKTKLVNLFVKPDSSSEPGKYFVVIRAETRLSQDEEYGITVIPERFFKFEIDLKGFAALEETENEKTIEFSGNGFDSNSEILKTDHTENGNQMNKEYFYCVVMFLVIIVSMLIYKKY
jgi:hypothetical protein